MIRPITLPLLVLALAGVLAMVISVGVGSVAISPADVLSVFLGEGSNLQRTLILELRLPRTLSAFATDGGTCASNTMRAAARSSGRVETVDLPTLISLRYRSCCCCAQGGGARSFFP